MNKTEALAAILHRLQQSGTDIEAATLFAEDGLVLANSLPQEMDQYQIVAMGSMMLSLAQRSAEELKRGTLEQLIVQGGQGYILVMPVGFSATLVAIARKGATLDEIGVEMHRAVENIADILEA